MVEEHSEEQKDRALEFRKRGDPGDRLRVHGVEGKPESSPESESGSAEGRNQEIDKHHDHGVQQDVDEVPAERVAAKKRVFRSVAEQLQGAIIVTAHTVVFVGLPSEVPNFAREDLAEVLALEDNGILKDLEFVVGDEVVAKGGGVEGEGEEEEKGEMEEAGAGGSG